MDTPSKTAYKRMATASGLLVFITLWMFYKSTDTNFNSSYLYIAFNESNNNTNNNINDKSEFLVFSSKCRIPNYDVFSEEIQKFYLPEKYFPCNQHPLLSYVTKNDNKTAVVLHIDEDVVSSYSKNGVACCWSAVTRKRSPDCPDNGINVHSCKNFKNNTTLTNDIFVVRCKDLKTKKEVYANAHTSFLITNTTQAKLQKLNNTASRMLSVLFVGIDSISRLNLMRMMPQTYRYLKEREWIEYKGYNKMGDNTFPNLMAIFTGKNESLAYSTCNPRKIGLLDKCNFIFFNYSAAGYVTAYAEDEAKINTFNYRKKGFENPPTDFYLRPYAMAAEQLKIVKKDFMDYCVGPESYGERILNAAKDFAVTFKNQANFGFFWMNSFSHNELNSPSRLDFKVRGFLRDITSEGILNNSLVIFLSDHGLRFGEIRYTGSGWLEERLPYLFFSVPKWFQKAHPHAYENLIKNADKLTSPYDLHMTLQDVLIKSGVNYAPQAASGCPGCKSLFEPAEDERSCSEAGISQHWCTCEGYKKIATTEELVMDGAWSVINTIEAIRQKNQPQMKDCAKYKLKKVLSSDISDNSVMSYRNNTFLKFVFETAPYAVFEATVEVVVDDGGDRRGFVVQSGISRLNYYGYSARCVKESHLQPYCYCR